MIIFDSNVVLVDSEPLAATLLSKEFMRAGFALTPGVVAHFCTGSRPADIFATVEIAAGRKLPRNLSITVAIAIQRQFHVKLRATPHSHHALT